MGSISQAACCVKINNDSVSQVPPDFSTNYERNGALGITKTGSKIALYDTKAVTVDKISLRQFK